MRQKECILYRNFENEELLDKMTQVIEEGERELPIPHWIPAVRKSEKSCTTAFLFF